MILDQRYRNGTPFAGITPRSPFPGRWLKAGVVVKADTIAELAEKAGLRPTRSRKPSSGSTASRATVRTRTSGRGDSATTSYYGDPRLKNPSLAEISKAPFYAIKMVPGDIGTRAAPHDVDGRALREDGSVIEGLYAAGNCSSPVRAHTYAGRGATIGPAMTFAYLAVLDIADRARAAAPSVTN